MLTRLLHGTALAALLTSCAGSGSDPARQAAARADIGSAVWSTAAPLPEERTEVSLASDGTRLYLLGGLAPSNVPGERATAPRTLFTYDPEADAWSAAGEIQEGLHHTGFVFLDGRFYVVGGFRGASFTPTGAVHVYDPQSRVWSAGAPMPTPRGAMAVVVLDGRIHAIGGNVSGPAAVHDHADSRITGDNSVATHEVYDPRTNAWSRLPAMPTARNHHGAAVVDGRIHVVGGRADGVFELTVHEVYDPAAGRWSTAAPLPTGRSGIGVVEHFGRVYVFGGETFASPNRTFGEVERYDPTADRWESLPPMPTSRHGLGVAAAGNTIHVVSGGPQPGFTYGTTHERLRVVGGTE